MTLSLGNFLEAFKDKLLGEERFKEKIIEIVFTETKTFLKKEEISYRNQNIHLKTDPYTKTEINLHKESILKKLREAFPEKGIKDIF